MILIKLGGSIITHKDKPLSPNVVGIKNLASQLNKVKEPMVVVHGGGSFGHYWSVKYDMHTKPAKYNKRGVAVVKNSMIELNKIIIDLFLKNDLNPYCFPPTDFMVGNKADIKKIREIGNIAKIGMIPITYGDALWFGRKKFYILSGDKIMGILSKILKPRMVIFAMNVDGVYSDMKTKKLLPEIKGNEARISEVKMDVTGGMNRKITEALSISKNGTLVIFVNGNKPNLILKAINGKFEGTLFRGN